MRIVADESVDGPVVRWLRDRGHEVVWMAEVAPGTPDGDVLARATDRVLLTGDRDFGRMVFLEGAAAAGVVYLRIPRPPLAGDRREGQRQLPRRHERPCPGTSPRDAVEGQ